MDRSKIRIAVIGGGVAALLAVGVGLAVCGGAAESTGKSGAGATTGAPRAASAQKRPAAARHAGGATKKLLAPGARTDAKAPAKPVLEFDDDDDKRTPAEKALAERIEKALDEERLEDALACAKDALVCANTEIRQAMVETLGWFGEKALPELTPFLADADEDVRESAMNEWSMAVSNIEDDAEKIGVVELAMNVLSDEDALEDISGEYIGVDEKLAVESLVRIIAADGSKTGVAKAKETYEFVTGDEFTDRAAAEKWLAEEYEPPDAD